MISVQPKPPNNLPPVARSLGHTLLAQFSGGTIAALPVDSLRTTHIQNSAPEFIAKFIQIHKSFRQIKTCLCKKNFQATTTKSLVGCKYTAGLSLPALVGLKFKHSSCRTNSYSHKVRTKQSTKKKAMKGTTQSDGSNKNSALQEVSESSSLGLV